MSTPVGIRHCIDKVGSRSAAAAGGRLLTDVLDHSQAVRKPLPLPVSSLQHSAADGMQYTISLIPPQLVGVEFFIVVCLSVCLSVNKIASSKSYGSIFAAA